MTFGKLTFQNRDYILQCCSPYYLGLITIYDNLDSFVLRSDKQLIQAECISKLSTITIKGRLMDNAINSVIEVSAEGINNLNQLASQMANYYSNN